jgi:predicted glycosyltransferase
MLHYTGYIVRPTATRSDASDDGADEVLVTAGGGPVGRRLFEIAIEAARKSGSRQWRMLVGGFDAAEQCIHLNAKAAGAPAVAELTRVDYREMLTRCAAAVGQCGYNTAIDWLQAGVPGVFVPFADAGEVEQTRRAELFRRRYGYGVIAEDELTPDNLIVAVDEAIERGRVVIDDADLDGGRGAVRIIEDMLWQRC